MDRFVPVVCHSARMYCLFWSVICWYTILLYRYFCKSQIGPFYMFKKKKKKESSLTLSFSPQQTTEYQSLHQGYSQYESLSLSLLRRKKEAETTLLFWKTHSGKTTVSTTLLSYLNLLTPCHLLCGWKKNTQRFDLAKLWYIEDKESMLLTIICEVFSDLSYGASVSYFTTNW